MIDPLEVRFAACGICLGRQWKKPWTASTFSRMGNFRQFILPAAGSKRSSKLFFGSSSSLSLVRKLDSLLLLLPKTQILFRLAGRCRVIVWKAKSTSLTWTIPFAPGVKARISSIVRRCLREQATPMVASASRPPYSRRKEKARKSSLSSRAARIGS